MKTLARRREAVSLANLLALAPLLGPMPSTGVGGDPDGVSFPLPGVEHELAHPDLAEGDNFGTAVALLRDELLVGAPFEDAAGPDSGAVHRFRRVNGAWQWVGRLLPADVHKDQRFGVSLDVDTGRGVRLIVGSPGDGSTFPGRGSAYVFERTGPPGNAWIERAKLEPSSAPLDGVQFGTSVALDRGLAVVGAPLESNEIGALVGNAYVYRRDELGAWRELEKLYPDIAPSGAVFGTSVDVVGERIAVGAPFIGQSFLGGRAHVFGFVHGTLTLEQTLQAPVPGQRDRFGTDVALFDERLAVGAPRDRLPNIGFVTVFLREANAAWTEAETFVSPEPSTLDRFGSRVAVRGSQLLVGAPTADGIGAAFLFDVGGPSALLLAEYRPSDGTDVDLFGVGIALGTSAVAIGAPQHDDAGADSGTVYLFE